MISPKINTSTVITAVAIPAPMLPKIRIAIVVVRDVNEIFTRLFPTKTLESIWLGFSINFKTIAAFLLPSSAMARILCGLTVVSVFLQMKNKQKALIK